jgi:hypothetical protein
VKRAALVPLAGLLLGALLGCGGSDTLEPCGITERACQEAVYYGVLRLRGDGWDPFRGLPPIRTISLEQFRSELVGSEEEPPPDEAAAEPDPWSTALQILGLVTLSSSAAQASVESQVSNVAAFYEPATGKVTVIDRGQQRNDTSDTILLAHELVHAFQDKELSGGNADLDTDGDFAVRALIEGEAVLYEHLAAVELLGRSATRPNWAGYYGDWVQGLRESMPSQRSPFFAAAWFVYPLGGDLMTDAWLRGGNAAVRRLGSSHPLHSAQYMAAATHGTLGSGYDRAPRCRPARSVADFELWGADRFGAIQLYAFLARAGIEEAAAWRLSLGWRDDRLEVYFDEAPDDPHTLVIWRVSMVDAQTAEEAAALLAALETQLTVEAIDGDLQIAGSDLPDALEASGSIPCR